VKGTRPKIRAEASHRPQAVTGPLSHWATGVRSRQGRDNVQAGGLHEWQEDSEDSMAVTTSTPTRVGHVHAHVCDIHRAHTKEERRGQGASLCSSVQAHTRDTRVTWDLASCTQRPRTGLEDLGFQFQQPLLRT
jgi:hypothetical protein